MGTARVRRTGAAGCERSLIEESAALPPQRCGECSSAPRGTPALTHPPTPPCVTPPPRRIRSHPPHASSTTRPVDAELHLGRPDRLQLPLRPRLRRPRHRRRQVPERAAAPGGADLPRGLRPGRPPRAGGDPDRARAVRELLRDGAGSRRELLRLPAADEGGDAAPLRRRAPSSPSRSPPSARSRGRATRSCRAALVGFAPSGADRRRRASSRSASSS